MPSLLNYKNEYMSMGQFDEMMQMQALRRAAYDLLGYNYRSGAGVPAAFHPLSAFGIIGTLGQGFYFRGQLSGHAFGNQGFTLADITARKFAPKSDRGTSRRAGFEGVVLSLIHPMVFHGRTVIRRDLGRVNPQQLDGMKRVGLVPRVFEEKFEVYSDDQVEARMLMTPDFIERLMHFANDYLGRGVQCAFLGGQIHVTLEIDDRFDFAGDAALHSFKVARRRMSHEVGAVFRLVEAVQTLQASLGAQGHEGADRARASYYKERMQYLLENMGALEANWRARTDVPASMQDVHYLFCDTMKGLLFPRI